WLAIPSKIRHFPPNKERFVEYVFPLANLDGNADVMNRYLRPLVGRKPMAATHDASSMLRGRQGPAFLNANNFKGRFRFFSVSYVKGLRGQAGRQEQITHGSGTCPQLVAGDWSRGVDDVQRADQATGFGILSDRSGDVAKLAREVGPDLQRPPDHGG